MKKIIITLTILAVAIFSFTANVSAVNYELDTDNTFNVTHTGTPGGYYTIIIVEGIAEKCPALADVGLSLQYFDQQTADANGNVLFKDILLKTQGALCSIFVGGVNIDEPIFLGYVNNAPSEFTVSGVVTSQSSSEATVTFVSTTDATKLYSTNTVSGRYEIKLPADTYKMTAAKDAHLSYTKNSFEVSEDIIKNVSLKSGDITADGVIDFNDFSEILKAYLTASKTIDINGDGVVDFGDFSEMTKNYMLTATIEE